MKVDIEKNDLQVLIKEAVREVLHEERLDFLLKSISPVSKEESKDIETLYGKPSEKKDVAYNEIDLKGTLIEQAEDIFSTDEKWDSDT